MTGDTSNRHSDRSAKTRGRFIQAAQKLFAERSIDAVSLNEITVAAGQKNRNALQYHFGNREGLLQAIIDNHAVRVQELRQQLAAQGTIAQEPPARAAALALVTPLVRYVEENSEAIFYVKLLSQLAAQNSPLVNTATRSGITFQHDAYLDTQFRAALAHLSPAEAQRRLFLVLSITFHSIADICRASELRDTSPGLRQQGLMFDQVILCIEAMLAAPAREAAD